MGEGKAAWASLFLGMAITLTMSMIALTATASAYMGTETAIVLLMVAMYEAILASLFGLLGFIFGVASLKSGTPDRGAVILALILFFLFTIGYFVVIMVL